MGLDICVKRLVEKPKRKDDYFRLVNNDGKFDDLGFPEWTKKFIHTKTETWYDWDKFKEQTGIDMENMKWYGTFYGENGDFMHVYPNDVELPDYSKDYPGGYDAYEADLEKIIIKVDLDKVPTKKVKIKVVYYEEVGYQRKGLNGKFYDDYDEGKIGYFVWTKAELERYKKDYCDEPHKYVYPNGEESDDMVYPKDNFQRNVIDNFEEGKDCVIFSW